MKAFLSLRKIILGAAYPQILIKNVLIQRFKFFKLGCLTQKQTGEMPKTAPSNPLLLKGVTDPIFSKHKIAKNTYIALLRAIDIRGFRGINLRKN